MATINHKTYNEGTETFKDFSVYDGKDTLIFKVDGSAQSAAVTGTLDVSGNAAFDTNTLYVDATNNRVGIGLTDPASYYADNLVVSAGANGGITIVSSNTTNYNWLAFADGTTGNEAYRGLIGYYHTNDSMRFYTSAIECLRITDVGVVEVRNDVPVLTLYNTDTSLTTSQSVGDIDFYQVDPSGAGVGLVGRIRSVNESSFQGAAGLAFYTGDASTFTERVRITAAGILDLTQGQIKFPATQVASADPNTLDDYEEGTFTPVLNFSGGTTGITYSQQLGRYTKIGNVVNFILVITLTNKGTSTGGANIGGLPFPIPNGAVNYGPFNIGAIINTSFNTFPSAIGIINTSYMVLEENVSGGTQSALTEADFANNSELRISGTYFV